jgi:hypothetical protein
MEVQLDRTYYKLKEEDKCVRNFCFKTWKEKKILESLEVLLI